MTKGKINYVPVPSVRDFNATMKKVIQGDTCAINDALDALYGKVYSTEQARDLIAEFIDLADNKDNATAQNALSCVFEDGLCVKKSKKKASEYRHMAAQNGDDYADSTIAKRYLHSKNKSEAKKGLAMLKKQAEQGNIASLNALGCAYGDGKGVKKNAKKAFACFKAAAKKEELNAIYNMGRAYLKGIGVKKNKKKAEQYFAIAAGRGQQSAIKEINKLGKDNTERTRFLESCKNVAKYITGQDKIVAYIAYVAYQKGESLSVPGLICGDDNDNIMACLLVGMRELQERYDCTEKELWKKIKAGYKLAKSSKMVNEEAEIKNKKAVNASKGSTKK